MTARMTVSGKLNICFYHDKRLLLLVCVGILASWLPKA